MEKSYREQVKQFLKTGEDPTEREERMGVVNLSGKDLIQNVILIDLLDAVHKTFPYFTQMTELLQENHLYSPPYVAQFTSHSTPSRTSTNERVTPSDVEFTENYMSILKDENEFESNSKLYIICVH